MSSILLERKILQAKISKVRLFNVQRLSNKPLGEVRGYGGQQGQGEGQGDYIWSQAPPLVLPSGPTGTPSCPNSPPTVGQGSKLPCTTQMKSPAPNTIKVLSGWQKEGFKLTHQLKVLYCLKTTLGLEYWAGGYSVNPLWLSVGGVADCPQGFGNPRDGARATVGEGEGANREQDTGILASDPLQYTFSCHILH